VAFPAQSSGYSWSSLSEFRKLMTLPYPEFRRVKTSDSLNHAILISWSLCQNSEELCFFWCYYANNQSSVPQVILFLIILYLNCLPVAF
jgi:hypothetical protein